jgi:hypothetical protein
VPGEDAALQSATVCVISVIGRIQVLFRAVLAGRVDPAQCTAQHSVGEMHKAQHSRSPDGAKHPSAQQAECYQLQQLIIC